MGALEPAVMVIDDDDHLREAMAMLLEAHGYEVDGCADARQALKQLDQGATPDVILLDLMMPHMDGWQFRVEQKREARWANIPVVALSADLSAKARAIDAHVYLSKPVDDKVLLETVEHLVHTLAGARVRERAPKPDDTDPLGTLASVIAHEVNNPLSFVVGNLELAQQRAAELVARLPAKEQPGWAELRRLLARGQRGADRIRVVMENVAALQQGYQPGGTRDAQSSQENEARRSSPQRASVLVVDDEPMMCELISALLANEYDVCAFSEPRAALAALEERSFDVVLCDLMMPSLTGMDVYEQVAARQPELAERFIFISGGAFTERARNFLASSPRPHLRKPFRRQDLIYVVETQLALSELRQLPPKN